MRFGFRFRERTREKERESGGHDKKKKLTFFSYFPSVSLSTTNQTKKHKKGDALLNYENEIIATNEAGEVSPLPYVVPSTNIKVKMPVAAVDGNLRRWPAYSRDVARDAAKAFVEFCFTPEAQQELNDAGFRPVVKIKKPRNFPRVKKLLSVEEDFGGWDAVQEKMFSAGGVLDRINDAVAGRAS